MFNKIIKRGHKKGLKQEVIEPPNTNPDAAPSVTVNHASRASIGSPAATQQITVPNSGVVEILPALRDVPVADRHVLFIKKLQLCCVSFDFSEAMKNAKEKEIKRQTLSELVDLVQSGSWKMNEIIQEEMIKMISVNLFRCLPPSAHENTGGTAGDDEDDMYLEPSWPHLQIVYELLLRYVVSSDTDTKVAKRYLDHSFVLKLLDLFDSEDPREREYLKTVLHRVYGKFMVHRPCIRKAINNIFYRFIFETERHSGIGELLEILGSIINGFALPMKEEHKLFLVRALIPLHKPKSVSTYHQQLSYCITQFVEKDFKLSDTVIRGILRYWPVTNCGKEVLFLGELEEVLEATQSSEFQRCLVPLFRQISRCLNSPHFQVGDFSDDNRSGINNSLHRISAIRNRKLQIIGLTCRVGRAVSGSAEIIRDLIEGGGSILVIGPPGVGKTTLIREIARMLADERKKRVVIIDTSNEIGGDGDVPHAGIGRARRMQVPNVNMQHNVMIEAVENHTPQTIIIDEIGTELEALAASTISQRGVQLVGTAHGMTIDNIMKNPSLQILVGGIESVTLGDEEARKRKVQKTILERKGPPTFTCAVEMISRTECRVHHRLDATVDALLKGKSPLFEIRHMDAEANNKYLKFTSTPELSRLESDLVNNVEKQETESDGEEDLSGSIDSSSNAVRKRSSPVYVYTYKILEADLQQVAAVMGLEDELYVTDDIGMADALLATSSELKQNPWIRSVAKFQKLPVFVIKSSNMAQMVKAIRMILEKFSSVVKSKKSIKSSSDIEIEDDAPKRKPSLEEIDALEEVRLAIEYIVIPGGEPVELLPRRSEIFALQLELVESYQLAVENTGTEMNPRMQILPHKLHRKASANNSKHGQSLQEGFSIQAVPNNGVGTSFPQLPLLPE